MFRKSTFALMAILVILSTVLAACGPAATAEPAKPAESKLSVGIVLPTKDEPRWIQDETRFKDALTKAGYLQPG
jgi:putative multiple sugar transport system substrate-binding protein